LLKLTGTALQFQMLTFKLIVSGRIFLSGRVGRGNSCEVNTPLRTKLNSDVPSTMMLPNIRTPHLHNQPRVRLCFQYVFISSVGNVTNNNELQLWLYINSTWLSGGILGVGAEPRICVSKYALLIFYTPSQLESWPRRSETPWLLRLQPPSRYFAFLGIAASCPENPIISSTAFHIDLTTICIMK
jgi:hypothetical protein